MPGSMVLLHHHITSWPHMDIINGEARRSQGVSSQILSGTVITVIASVRCITDSVRTDVLPSLHAVLFLDTVNRLRWTWSSYIEPVNSTRATLMIAG